MQTYYVEYDLRDGFVHQWLYAGPQAISVENLEQFQGADYKLQIAQHYYTPESLIADAPLEMATFSIDGADLRWRPYRALDDHLVDMTAFYHTTHYLRSWGFTGVLATGDQQVDMVLTTNGPADVWINGAHVHRQEHFSHQDPKSVAFQAGLKDGLNEILVRFEEVAARECPYAMALQIQGLEHPERPVRVPVTNMSIGRRLMLENILDHTTLDRDVYVSDQVVQLNWPEDMAISSKMGARLQKPDGRIYAEAHPVAIGGKSQKMVRAYEVPEGELRLFLMAPPEEYYEANMRVQKEYSLYAFRNKFSEQPYGSYDERRIEALRDAAYRLGGSLYSEIAKMELGLWKRLDPQVIIKALDKINMREDCSDFYLVGILGILARYVDDESFPADLRAPMEECVLNFKYWDDEPGADAMCYRTENHSILFHTCEVLAGQMFPERVFTNVNETGAWHLEKGTRLAHEWLQQRAHYGFQEWDSNCYFEEDILALAYLVDLCEDGDLQEMAAVVLDKMFFTMALNSFKGVFGSTHGRTYTPYIKGGRREATSGIQRIAWGMGCFNESIRGSVALACAKQYQVHDLLYAVAIDKPEEVWNRERHGAGSTGEGTDVNGPTGWGVDKVTYKTPDYMLASAQDYRPGQKGYQQHIWQATMGPDAVVFVTHPSKVSEEGSHRPNYWHGNYVLPRVAQWKDVLFAIHDLPEDDWLGFTHAYFPEYAFEEHALQDGWAFGKAGDGYIALYAAQGLERIVTGQNAFRELRSQGRKNIWVCQMGRAALDGTFEEFQEKVLAAPPEVDLEALKVTYANLRGQTLAFGWEGPLTIDGEEQAITGFKHYDSMYCEADLPATGMELKFLDWVLRLNFEAQE